MDEIVKRDQEEIRHTLIKVWGYEPTTEKDTERMGVLANRYINLYEQASNSLDKQIREDIAQMVYGGQFDSVDELKQVLVDYFGLKQI